MPELLLDSLLPPVPRIIYDSVVKYSDIQKFVSTLEDRKVDRENTPEGMLPQHDEVGPSLKNVSRQSLSSYVMYDGHRQTVLWASNAPVLSNTSLNDPSTSCGILAGVVDKSPFVLTGSSDQRIRYWDLMSPKNSALIVPSAKDNLADVSFTYSSRLTDGSQVIEENIISLAATDLGSLRASTDETPRSGREMPSHSHHDAITNLLMCKNDKQQIFIVSAARDGVIKLWK